MLRRSFDISKNIISRSLLNPMNQFGSTKLKKFRDKFTVDYQYFRSISPKDRDDELDRINALKKINANFTKIIPYFPINEIWDYHGTKLMTHTWEPPAKIRPKAVVVFHHSLNGHISTFGQFASHLASKGYVVTGFDFVNFGQSDSPKRGCLDSFEDLVTSSEQYIIKAKNKYSGLKIFTAGMSLGGAVTFNVLIKQPSLVDGAIFLSPSLRQNHKHFPMMKKLTVLFSTMFPYQKLVKQTGRNGTKYRLDHYSKNDPHLYHGRLYPKTVQQILLAMGRTRKLYHKFVTPYLCVQSGSDKLVDPFACLDLEDQSPGKDKTTVIIYDMWHAIWLDDHVHDVIQIVEEWLQQRV